MTIVELSIITKGGAVYTFPKVVEEAFLAVILPLLERPGAMQTVAVANTDESVLSVPLAKIKDIYLQKRKVWSCSA